MPNAHAARPELSHDLLPTRFERWQKVTVHWRDRQGAQWVVDLTPTQAYTILHSVPEKVLTRAMRREQWRHYFNGQGSPPPGATREEIEALGLDAEDYRSLWLPTKKRKRA